MAKMITMANGGVEFIPDGVTLAEHRRMQAIAYRPVWQAVFAKFRADSAFIRALDRRR